MATPQLNVRAPAEYHDLLRSIAFCLRLYPERAAAFWRICRGVESSGSGSESSALSAAIDELRERVAELERFRATFPTEPPQVEVVPLASSARGKAPGFAMSDEHCALAAQQLAAGMTPRQVRDANGWSMNHKSIPRAVERWRARVNAGPAQE